MRSASLISAAAIIVIANALALLHVASNRAGNPTAELTLTNDELQYFPHSQRDDDSGVTLVLQWTDPNSAFWPFQEEAPPKWLDKKKLESLGFDCSLNPANPRATTFYRRQRPRQVFVALEYDGPAWRVRQEQYERSAAQQIARAQPGYSGNFRPLSSRLVAIDTDLKADKLRIRHPDHKNILILPAVVAISLDPFPDTALKPDDMRQIRIIGHIQQVPSSIYVPRAYGDEFRRLHSSPFLGENKDVVYHVRLRYGSAHEPWVTGVEFTGAH